MYEGHSINKGNFLTEEQPIICPSWGCTFNKYSGNFFDWRATNYMYEGHSINKGNFLTEEQPIICMRDIQ